MSGFTFSSDVDGRHARKYRIICIEKDSIGLKQVKDSNDEKEAGRSLRLRFIPSNADTSSGSTSPRRRKTRIGIVKGNDHPSPGLKKSMPTPSVVFTFSIDSTDNRTLPRLNQKSQCSNTDYSHCPVVSSSVNSNELQDCRSPKQKLLGLCNQKEPIPFHEYFNDRVLGNDCKKIGEGTFGEIFMVNTNQPQCSTVLKIIPIEGDLLINDEKQKKFEEILSELVITINLSNLKKRTDYYTDNFADFKNCHCVYGRYPKKLIELRDVYKDKNDSENESPRAFDGNQLYVILELSHGGESFENFKLNNARQALSVFAQVTHALAVAETAFQFEHRDLHWGNILVSKSTEETAAYKIGEFQNSVKLRGVKVTIIDYTLSRISINNCILFYDIGTSPGLFSGDSSSDFQFEVYRLMRNAVKNNWKEFSPKTNVYWLKYLLTKMANKDRYAKPGTKIHRKNFKAIEELADTVEKCSSSKDLIKKLSLDCIVSAKQ
ncbi:serine/threonine-protein kinase haspin homolog isoform X2 [Planococcus citri]|uniref:serine/threonine-protein kinase haspin homolog isoform X2 n=1 Tax=Planococcus citri TaxID=170843 RepID=UPI0031F8E3BA